MLSFRRRLSSIVACVDDAKRRFIDCFINSSAFGSKPSGSYGKYLFCVHVFRVISLCFVSARAIPNEWWWMEHAPWAVQINRGCFDIAISIRNRLRHNLHVHISPSLLKIAFRREWRGEKTSNNEMTFNSAERSIHAGDFAPSNNRPNKNQADTYFYCIWNCPFIILSDARDLGKFCAPPHCVRCTSDDNGK